VSVVLAPRIAGELSGSGVFGCCERRSSVAPSRPKAVAVAAPPVASWWWAVERPPVVSEASVAVAPAVARLVRSTGEAAPDVMEREPRSGVC
jgi:hypothetical protein